MHRSDSSIEELTTSSVITLPTESKKGGHLTIAVPSMTIPSADGAIQSSITTTSGGTLDRVKGSGLDGIKDSPGVLPIRAQGPQAVSNLQTADSIHGNTTTSTDLSLP